MIFWHLAETTSSPTLPNWNKVRFKSFLWGALAGCYVRPLSRIGRAMFFVASATSAPFSALCSVMYSEYSFLRAPEKKWSLWVAQKKETSHSVIIAVTITVSIGIMVTYHSSTAIKFLTTVLSLLSLKWVISTSCYHPRHAGPWVKKEFCCVRAT